MAHLSGDKRAVGQRGSVLAADIVDRPYAEVFAQLIGGYLLHRTRSGSGARRRLRKCRRIRGMEGDVALDLLDDLVNVPVEHGHRAETLQIAERAAGVLGAPAPLLVDRPQWQVGHQYDRRARREPFDILLQPFELLVAELGEAGGFEAGLKLEHVDQADEVHARRVEAVPAFAVGVLTVAFEISLAVVGVGDVVLAGQEEYLLVGGFDDVIGVVPLLLLGEVADIAGMDEKGGLRRHRLDLRDCLGERGAWVRVWRLVKADMAVADLNKSERTLRRLGGGSPADQAERARHAAA